MHASSGIVSSDRRPHAGQVMTERVSIIPRASYRNHHLAARVSLFDVAYRFGHLLERVGAIDDRRDLCGCDEVFQMVELAFGALRDEARHTLAHERAEEQSAEHGSERPDRAAAMRAN